MFKKLIKKLINKKLSRVEVINYCLELFVEKRYLEIGVRRGETIARVNAREKTGVDPFLQLEKIDPRFKLQLEQAKNIEWKEVKSDDFFAVNKKIFDVIFLDGLHLYEQCIKDILNALNCLSEYGIIIVHDCNPKTRESASRIHGAGEWSGDVWKAIYDLKNNYPNLDYFILDTDTGLGIITKHNFCDDFSPNFDASLIDLDYSILEDNRQKILNLTPPNFLFKFLKKQKKKIYQGLITGILAISDYPTLDYVPYRECIESALDFVDKLIIVYGGNIRKDGRNPVREYLFRIKDKRIIIKNFPWPEEFNWTQFSLSYGYARSFISTKWGIFLTCDEIIPKYWRIFRLILRVVPWFIDYVSVWRLFLVDNRRGSLYTRKSVIFRNKYYITFGMISNLEPPKSNFHDFGRLINIKRWFDGKEYININNDFNQGLIIQLQRQGVLLRGFRDLRWYKTLPLPFYYINTHTLFVPEEILRPQVYRIYLAYVFLPIGYPVDISKRDVVKDFKDKVNSQRNRRLIPLFSADQKKIMNYRALY